MKDIGTQISGTALLSVHGLRLTPVSAFPFTLIALTAIFYDAEFNSTKVAESLPPGRTKIMLEGATPISDFDRSQRGDFRKIDHER